MNTRNENNRGYQSLRMRQSQRENPIPRKNSISRNSTSQRRNIPLRNSWQNRTPMFIGANHPMERSENIQNNRNASVHSTTYADSYLRPRKSSKYYKYSLGSYKV